MLELRYHHIGMPTEKELPAEDYLPDLKMHASGYMESPYRKENL